MTDQLTDGYLFPSFSFLSGDSPLTRKICTQFASVKCILEDDNDPTTKGIDVVLSTSSNRIDRVHPVFIVDKNVGKQHAVILRADTVPADRRSNFPHGPEFTAADAPILEPFFVADSKAAKHIVALPPSPT